MSSQRCVAGQSKLGIMAPFDPIIGMQEWMGPGDSLARPGQDWPDGLLIRPATLSIELSIAWFPPVLVVH